ncbi:tRNA lysidine(34) synthetase TilS [Streptomyces sp. 71268]|uniref:tRNA lysidine(34) synthetase TilS n=1 Tax=Streptomyces sp. 71268 TaxID=3002640 RepID=UPI0023F67F33|nr:tRNA lysidine(34) synthetase TilS [Streptomyces sp. 71268]WEV26909.1 tRNA lysidine(34) synthetase TilS [Streptomyces sp. 71268]
MAPPSPPAARGSETARGGAARSVVPAPGGSPLDTAADPRPLILVACSGGADSMALASALAFEAPKLGLRAGGVTVDHGLQPGSDARAVEVCERLRALGLDPVESIAVAVGRDGGPEAAARDARYGALDHAAERYGARAVLLGHTRDDQAETVLLGLARGSGTRSLSGMAVVSGEGGRYRRPFLHLDRQTARRACLAQSLPVWDDPHNADPAFTRSRVRHEALPMLEKALGKGVVEALARTAQLSRDDADALDAWAAEAEAVARAARPVPKDRATVPTRPTAPSHPTPRPASAPPGARAAVRPTADAPAGGPSPVPSVAPPVDAAPAAGASPASPTGSVGSLTRSRPSAAAEPCDVIDSLDTAALRDLPAAVRRRVLRRVAIAAGSPAGSLFARHIEEVDRLITSWHGQRAINLPGRIEVLRQGGRLVIRQG